MFNLYKRKGYRTYYANVRIRLPDGTNDRKQINTNCTDRRQAEEWSRLYEAQRFAELVQGQGAPPAPDATPRTLRDALALMGQHCASQLAAGELAKATVDYYELHLGHFVRIWGDTKPLAEITTGAARQYVQQRLTEPGIREGKTVTLHTITKELGALRIALKLAKEHDWYPHDPRALVPTGVTSGYTPRTRVLTAAELDALKAELDEPRWAVVAFAVATGAEASALRRARYGDVDLDEGFVVVRGSKNEKRENRAVPIVLPLAKKLLRQVLTIAKENGNPLGMGDARLLRHWHNLNRDLGLACDAAGIPRCSPNDLRRTFATWHAAAGISHDTLKHAMGHSTSKMLDLTYDKPNPNDIRTRMKREIKGKR